ncbi:L,D-transpeptidase family protein [Atlantibacter hermannii]|uniref:L,D-transpeptidase family protein n=1 Tax=Atlantibacter hermannii TaxID=565 RepID=UPI001933D538|nr:L,D-transpeptidase [Atlantibacter hermannii]MBL7635489.1 L,D-transpeptidase [Atlantibacter hermannii]MBL7673196.1 L,D-transpeptidase [Atlantibacter hermannii]
MSRLVFNGENHQLSLLDGDFTVVGSWKAYNNVDSRAKIKILINGSYSIQDKKKPHLHPGDNEDGSYGSYGIIRFNYPGHPGIGVHSGQAHNRYKPGPEHATMGCIRTTDEAMKKIKDYMETSPLTTITIKNNSGPSVDSPVAPRSYHPVRTWLA